MTNQTASNKSDVWIAIGVVLCLGVGASMTFWLTSGQPGAPRRRAAQGAPLNSAAAAAPGTTASLAPAAVPGNSEFLPLTFDLLGSYLYEIPNLQTPAQPVAVVKSDPARTLDKPAKPEEKVAAAAPKVPDQIPAPVKALNNKKVSVQGFMVPMKVEKGATKLFLLVKDTSLCCFGRMPRMNEWISVKMSEGRSAKFIGDQPVTVFGKIEVGEEIKDGEVLSIYRMDADDVAGPLDL